MKKLLLGLGAIAFIFLVFNTGCKKDNFGDPVPFEPFVDKSDHKTTSIESTLPRIILRNGKLMVFLVVTDQNQAPIKGLNKHNFVVETVANGVSSEITTHEVFGGGGGTPSPIGAALTLDYSGSMFMDSTDIPNMEMAVKTFIGLKGATDFCELIKFDHNVYVVAPFTTNDTTLIAAVDDTSLTLQGATAFYRSCLVGLADCETLVTTYPTLLPAVVGFTDGVNNQAPLDPDTVVTIALQKQMPVYTIGYGNATTYPPDTATLKYIADTTGGRFYWVPTTSELQQLYQYVNGQLSNVYVIVFPFGNKDNALIRVKTTYECANGTFYSVSSKMIYY